MAACKQYFDRGLLFFDHPLYIYAIVFFLIVFINQDEGTSVHSPQLLDNETGLQATDVDENLSGLVGKHLQILGNCEREPKVLPNNIIHIEMERDKLQREKSDLEERYNQLQEKYNRLQEEHNNTKVLAARNYADQKMKNDTLQLNNDELQGRSDKLQNENNELKEKNKKLIARGGRQAMQNAELQTKYDRLRKKNEKLQEENEQLEQNIKCRECHKNMEVDQKDGRKLDEEQEKSGESIPQDVCMS